MDIIEKVVSARTLNAKFSLKTACNSAIQKMNPLEEQTRSNSALPIGLNSARIRLHESNGLSQLLGPVGIHHQLPSRNVYRCNIRSHSTKSEDGAIVPAANDAHVFARQFIGNNANLFKCSARESEFSPSGPTPPKSVLFTNSFPPLRGLALVAPN